MEWVRLPFLSEDMTLKMAKMFALTSGSRVTYKMEIHQHLVRTGTQAAHARGQLSQILALTFITLNCPFFSSISFITPSLLA
jgi:hypothetical protein